MKEIVNFMMEEAKRQKISRLELANAMGISSRVLYYRVNNGNLSFQEVVRGYERLGFLVQFVRLSGVVTAKVG